MVAKTDPAQRAKGISIVMVETSDQPGYRVGRVLDKIGQNGWDTAELFFDDVRVPADCLLGGVEGQGFAQLMDDLPYERTLLAISGVAAMEYALALTVDYTRHRKAFGKALLEMQNTRFKLAEVKTWVHVARVFIDDCIVKLRDGRLDTVDASMAKWWITRPAIEGGRRMPAALRRLRVHEGIPDLAALRRCARAAHLWRCERGSERDHRAVALRARRPRVDPTRPA